MAYLDNIDSMDPNMLAMGPPSTAGIQPRASFFQNVLMNVKPPNWKAKMGWNSLRMSNTSLYGGFGGRASFANSGGFRPASWLRMSSAEDMYGNAERIGGNPLHRMSPRFPWSKDPREARYTPFTQADLIHNTFTPKGASQKAIYEASKKAARTGEEVGDLETIGRKASSKFMGTMRGRLYQGALDKGWVKPGMEAFEGGIYSKFSTASRLARMDVVGGAGNSSRLAEKWMARSVGDGTSLMERYGMSEAGAWAGRDAAAHYMANAFTSTVGNRMAGYVAGARFGEAGVSMGSRTVSEGLSSLGTAFAAGDSGGMAAAGARMQAGSVFARSATNAVDRLASAGIERVGGKLLLKTGEEVGLKVGASIIKKTVVDEGMVAGAKLAGTLGLEAVGLAIPFVDVAMAAWMVYDVGKAIGGLISAGFDKAKQFHDETKKSALGQIEKPVFGMGFTDNSVAATSRQRGVAAIQNSRLNARSILGSEAGPLHAHFG